MLKASLAVAVAIVGAGCGVLTGGSPARADPAYDRCIDENTSNHAWAACGGALVEREQSALERAWTAVRGAASAAQLADLEAEQRAWTAYFDAACRYYVNDEAGREAQVLSYPTCRAEIIRARTAQLQRVQAELAPR